MLTPIYGNAQQARGFARGAINALLAFDKSPTGVQHVGEMYFQMGYVEMAMSEVFCNGIPFGETVNGVPQYTQPLTDADGFKLALSRLDTALTFLTATDATTQGIKNAVLITRGRIKVDLGDFAGAVAEVASVPTTYQYNFDYSIHHVRQRVVDHGGEREALHGGRQHEHRRPDLQRDSVRAAERSPRFDHRHEERPVKTTSPTSSRSTTGAAMIRFRSSRASTRV